MGNIRTLTTGFFVGLLFTAAVLSGVYFDQKFGDHIEELPILKELTDTYLLGWESVKEMSTGLLPDATHQNTRSVDAKAAPAKIVWRKDELVDKLKAKGFEGQKMKSAMHYLKYIDTHADLAVANQRQYGIFASIQLAQALLESNAGRSKLARNTNNHFGIKARLSKNARRKINAQQHERLVDSDFIVSAPAIAVFNMTDDHAYDRFEKYATVEDSYFRHTQLLTRSCQMGKVGCYSWIWTTYKAGATCDLSEQAAKYYYRTQLNATDFFGQPSVPYFAAAAAGLKMAGYATSKTYHKKLAYIIETYDLWKFDMAEEATLIY